MSDGWNKLKRVFQLSFNHVIRKIIKSRKNVLLLTSFFSAKWTYQNTQLVFWKLNIGRVYMQWNREIDKECGWSVWFVKSSIRKTKKVREKEKNNRVKSGRFFSRPNDQCKRQDVCRRSTADPDFILRRIIQRSRLYTGWSIVRRKLRKRKLAGVTVTGADVGHVLPRRRRCGSVISNTGVRRGLNRGWRDRGGFLSRKPRYWNDQPRRLCSDRAFRQLRVNDARPDTKLPFSSLSAIHSR